MLLWADNLAVTRQVHDTLLRGVNVPLGPSISGDALSDSTERYECYLAEVQGWRDLPSGAIELATPVPLEPGILLKETVGQGKAAAQPAGSDPPERGGAESADDVTS